MKSMVLKFSLIFYVSLGAFANSVSNSVPSFAVCSRTREVVNAIEDVLRKKCYELTLEDLAKIEWLDLHGKGIRSLQEDDFLGLKNLTDVNLGGNAIESFPEHLFRSNKALLEIQAYSNHIKDLPPAIFEGLELLEEINFSSNQIENLPLGLLKDNRHLWQIQLSNNRLSSLPPDLIQNLANLTEFWIDFNNIQQLPDKLFSGQTYIRLLNIGDNPLIRFPSSIHHLKIDYFCVNSEADLGTALARGPTFDRLQLRNVDNKTLPLRLAPSFPHLMELSLVGGTRSDLRQIPLHYLTGLDRLSSLYLAELPLMTVRNDDLRTLKNLTDISINSSPTLSILPDDLFQDLPVLKVVVLKDNKLAELPDGIFNRSPLLERVSLGGNPFSEAQRNKIRQATDPRIQINYN